MKRRDFMAGVAASILFTLRKGSTQAPAQRPRLLISNTDAFTGLGLLRTRHMGGMRPSDDMEGWALSWQIARQESFAEKSMAAMRAGHITKGVKPSRSWVDYARWSLAFDWLSGYPGFEPALRNRIADDLMEGASAMLASPDFADPGNYSYHNYAVRYLALPAFVVAALDGFAGCNDRCSTWRAQVTKCLANVLETTNVVSPQGSYHESMDYMRITWASLTLLAELQRTTTGVDPAHHYSVFRNIGNTYLYKLRTARPRARAITNIQFWICATRPFSVTPSIASKIPTAHGSCATVVSSPNNGPFPFSSSFGTTLKLHRAIQYWPARMSCPGSIISRA